MQWRTYENWYTSFITDTAWDPLDKVVLILKGLKIEKVFYKEIKIIIYIWFLSVEAHAIGNVESLTDARLKIENYNTGIIRWFD